MNIQPPATLSRENLDLDFWLNSTSSFKSKLNNSIYSSYMEFEIEDSNLTLKSEDTCVHQCINLPVLDSNYFSYSNFFENFMLKNIPCVIKNISNNWEATEKWVNNGKPNLDYLDEKYRNTNIIIYNCSERYFNSQKCEETILAEYLDKCREKSNDNLYYLKDWHLKLQCKDDNFYEVPIYFASDWLNEYFTQCTDDDYRFVYIGQNGTWTPLHADVFNSYSWSVNVCGQKRWIFFPPGEEKFLRDNLNNIPYDIDKISHTRQSFEVVQNPGEAIFVPSGWYHQVWNLEDTISINHNWVNGCNINAMWESLKINLDITKKEIEDCKEMDNFKEHCQTMLKAHFGINYKQFYEFLEYIAKNRLEMLGNKNKRTLFHGHIIGENHIMFDLHCIHRVLEDFINCAEVIETDNYFIGQFLLLEIEQTLNKNESVNIVKARK